MLFLGLLAACGQFERSPQGPVTALNGKFVGPNLQGAWDTGCVLANAVYSRKILKFERNFLFLESGTFNTVADCNASTVLPPGNETIYAIVFNALVDKQEYFTVYHATLTDTLTLAVSTENVTVRNPDRLQFKNQTFKKL